MIFVFFAVVTPLQRDNVPPEILHLDKIITLFFLEGSSSYVQGIFWDSDLIKVGHVDHFLKNFKNMQF